jgi:hypothetical protein
MDPLIEVSTNGGKNMRETCARVLAAALLTGAIATVVAMAAHLNGPNEAATRLAVPPSSLERTVRLTARPLARHRSAAKLVTTHTKPVRKQAEVIHRSLVVVHRHGARRPTPPPHRQLTESAPAPPTTTAVTAAPTPMPTPAPAPAPEPAPPVEVPAPAPSVEAQGEDQNQGQGHGRGHAYGHDKQDD